MPAESQGNERHYLGVAPVSYDSAGNPQVQREHLRFAPEFGGTGDISMFGRLAGSPDDDTDGAYARGFGRRSPRKPGNRVRLSRDGTMVLTRVKAKSAEQAADIAAAAFAKAGYAVQTPFGITKLTRSWVVRAVIKAAGITASELGGNPDGQTDDDLADDFGKKKAAVKHLKPNETFALIGKNLKGKHFKQKGKLYVRLVAASKKDAIKFAKNIAKKSKVKLGKGKVTAKLMGVFPAPPPAPFPIPLTIWSVGLPLPRAAKAAAKASKPITTPAEAHASVQTPQGDSPMPPAAEMDWSQEKWSEADVDTANAEAEAFVERRYNDAIKALLADEFGYFGGYSFVAGNPDGQTDDDLADDFGLNYDEGDPYEGALGGCGCR